MILIESLFEAMNSRHDKSWKLTFSTQELSPEKGKQLQTALHGFVVLAIKENPFTAPELNDLDKLVVEYTDTEKSPSKRLKAVFYRVWEIDNEGYKDFTDYYRAKMDTLINHFKNKLP